MECAIGRQIPAPHRSGRGLLRLLNGLRSSESAGLAHLRALFAQVATSLRLALDQHQSLVALHGAFFAKAGERLKDPKYSVPDEISAFRRCFGKPTGVTIQTSLFGR